MKASARMESSQTDARQGRGASLGVCNPVRYSVKMYRTSGFTAGRPSSSAYTLASVKITPAFPVLRPGAARSARNSFVCHRG